MISDAIWKRFIAKVDRTDTCWLWRMANHTRCPYGSFYIPNDPGLISAHRAAYRIFVGPIPKGKFVLHDCDNPRCVNPFHLFLGNAQDNMSDKVRKGRQARGAKHGMARLTEAQVIEMRKLYKGNTARQVAEVFNVRIATVRAALGRTWKHIVTIVSLLLLATLFSSCASTPKDATPPPKFEYDDEDD